MLKFSHIFLSLGRTDTIQEESTEEIEADRYKK